MPAQVWWCGDSSASLLGSPLSTWGPRSNTSRGSQDLGDPSPTGGWQGACGRRQPRAGGRATRLSREETRAALVVKCDQADTLVAHSRQRPCRSRMRNLQQALAVRPGELLNWDTETPPNTHTHTHPAARRHHEIGGRPGLPVPRGRLKGNCRRTLLWPPRRRSWKKSRLGSGTCWT